MLQCRKVEPRDIGSLQAYFKGLSEETKNYFAPHAFDEATLTSICNKSYKDYKGFVCANEDKIAAYAVVKKEFSENEAARFSKYPIPLNKENDYLMAPSVADAFQSQGIGSILLAFLETELIKLGAEKIILWGGVQARNERAVRFYVKNSFLTLGEFHHNGLQNLDMVKHLVKKV